jgi:hypothetical protein
MKQPRYTYPRSDPKLCSVQSVGEPAFSKIYYMYMYLSIQLFSSIM